MFRSVTRLSHILVGGAARKLQVSLCPTFRTHFQAQFNVSLKMGYSVVEKGSPYSADYRVYIHDQNGPVSPLHDIPLVADADKKIYNMVVEVPRWSNAKMEITMKEILNPIKQDIKKGKPRFVANCFPHHGYIWNYGALPQTWENPEHLDDGTGCKGDNDPIDVLEIGYRVAKRGEILQVKVLGTIALIDEGETDWKLITIDVNDPAADQLNDVSDVEKVFPGLLKASVEWFKIYKIPDGKPENQFAFNGEAKNSEFAHKIIDEVHGFWKALVSKEVDAKGISCVNTTLDSNSFKISTNEAKQIVNKQPEFSSPQPVDPIGEKMSISDLFGLNSPRGLLGNSSGDLCTPPHSSSQNLQLNLDEAKFNNEPLNGMGATSTPIRNVQRHFSLGSAGSSPSTPPSFYVRRSISFSDSCPSNSPSVQNSPFRDSPSVQNSPFQANENSFNLGTSPVSDFGENSSLFDTHLSDLLNSLTVNDNLPNNSFGTYPSTDLNVSHIQNLQIAQALKHLQNQISPSYNQVAPFFNWSNGSSLGNTSLSDDIELERAARFHRSAAAFYNVVCTWSGNLPGPTENPSGFSSKVFLGGVPWDISEQCLMEIFKHFSPVKVEWPVCKNSLASQRKGYAYMIFESEKCVKALLQSCMYETNNWYFKIGTKRMKPKHVQVIPWALNDANCTKSTSQKLDPSKTVFVGALHGMLTAQGLAQIMNDLFDGVVYAGIDTDKHKYPLGSGRVTFNNPCSYMKAIAAAFVEIKTAKFTKKVQIDPYLEESMCTFCGVQQGLYFCRDFFCFRYYCRTCWNIQHGPELKHHSPMSRNSKNKHHTAPCQSPRTSSNAFNASMNDSFYYASGNNSYFDNFNY